MSGLHVLISCRLVWDSETEVRSYLEARGISAAVPRFEGQQLEEPELLELLPGYDGILAGDDHLTRRVIEASPRLKVISKWGIGVDAIDAEAAAEYEVAVFNTPGVFGDELADYAMGFVHLLARKQHEVDARIRAGEWHKVQGVSLAAKTLGIVGLGSSGRALARRAAAASMTVLGYDIQEPDEPIDGCELVDFETLLSRSDLVSLHLPATPNNYHLLDEEALSEMPRGAWLINISRGSLVDEDALVRALNAGHIGAAALDVFEKEPLEASNPLLGFENVVLGSHNGSNTREAVERTTWKAVNNLLRGLGMAPNG